MMEDMPQLGRVVVTREQNVWCACDNGWIYSVTFAGKVGRGDVGLLGTSGGALTGDGAAVSAATTLVDAPVLNGTFALISPRDPSLRSRELAFDAEGHDVAVALAEVSSRDGA